MGQALSAVFVLGFLVWVAWSARAGETDREAHTTDGSRGAAFAGAMPCGSSIRWRLADVDPRFGVSRDWVAEAAREAARTWGSWEGRPLLEEDEAEGVPVRLEYDARQARLAERIHRETELRALDESIEGRDADLSAAIEAHRMKVDALREEREVLHDAVAEHNRAVARWSGSDRVPADVEEQLDQEAARLERREIQLRDAMEALMHEADDLEARENELEVALAERDARWDALSRDFPVEHLEAAVYRASRDASGEGGHREIRVFTFRDRAELVWTLAHEFGHALGVEHSDDRDALMRGEQVRPSGGPADATLTAADLRALERLCDAQPDSVSPR